MISITPNRIEVKYQGDETNLNAIYSWIKDHPMVFREAYPARQVNSLYFDSDFYECCSENLSGTGNRAKIRYRWYGQGFKPKQGALEFKLKTNGVGYKRIYKIGESIDLTEVSASALRQNYPRMLSWRIVLYSKVTVGPRCW